MRLFTNHYLKFKIFDEFSQIDCRFYGKNQDTIKNVEDKIIWMEQIHGNKVCFIDKSYNKRVIKRTDGVVTTGNKIFLGVCVADCVPAFLFDPTAKIISVFHSGWKGTLKNIAKVAVKEMQKLGANPKKIKCALGPAICEKCYTVNSNRVKLFKKKFAKLSFKNNRLDLKKIVRHELIMSGVSLRNIETSALCTNCDNNKYYSFRNGDKIARNIGIIRMIN